jgi:hypothetical protein
MDRYVIRVHCQIVANRGRHRTDLLFGIAGSAVFRRVEPVPDILVANGNGVRPNRELLETAAVFVQSTILHLGGFSR